MSMSDDPSVRIEPAAVDLSRTASPRPGMHRMPRLQRRSLRVAAGVTGLLVLLALVLFVLPERMRVPATVPLGPPAMAPGPAAAPSPPIPAAGTDPIDEAERAGRRQEAQATLERVRALAQELERRGVQRWAPRRFAAAGEAREAGDGAYRQLDYAGAAARYAEAEQALQALHASVEQVLAEALAAGAEALAGGDAAAAAQAFDLALAIEPDNEPALEGRARAATLDQVLALVAAAREHEQAGRWQEARDAYRQALELDGETQAARDGAARAAQALAQRAYEQAMSEGFAALDGGRTDAAVAAFERVLQMRPGDKAAREALAQARGRATDERLATLIAEARALEAREDWWGALVRYDATVKLDPTLVAANEGMAQAKARAELDVKLQEAIGNAERLSSEAVRREVSALRTRAGKVRDPGPRLQGQVERLGALLEQAVTPVPVTLESDGLTRVTVHRVGEIGRFERHELSLTPGRYVAVGSRDGFRDVRVAFRVSHDAPPEPVRIQCEERIAFGR